MGEVVWRVFGSEQSQLVAGADSGSEFGVISDLIRQAYLANKFLSNCAIKVGVSTPEVFPQFRRFSSSPVPIRGPNSTIFIIIANISNMTLELDDSGWERLSGGASAVNSHNSSLVPIRGSEF